VLRLQLVPVRSGGSRPPFFCLHGAWGSVVFGAELARRLSSDQPFYGLEAPGLDGEQEPFTRIQDMAAHHVREMRRVQPRGLIIWAD
jgi:thioesterase domain-containing protein